VLGSYPQNASGSRVKAAHLSELRSAVRGLE